MRERKGVNGDGPSGRKMVEGISGVVSESVQ